ncbi:hypothetical protein D3C78_1050730 [compost metagenome]
MGDADPAGTLVVVFVRAIPRELHLDPAPFIAINLFPGRADYRGDLRAVDAGFVTQWGFPVGGPADGCGLHLVGRAAAAAERFFLQAAVLFACVGDGDGAPAVVEVFTRVLVEVERQPRLQARIVTGHMRQLGVVAQGGQAGFGEGLAGDVAFVAAGIVVTFIVLVLVVQVLVAGGGVLLVVVRMGEGVVALYLACGAHLFGVVEAVQRRFHGIAAGHGLVEHRAIAVGADGAEAADAIGKDEGVAVGAVFEAVEQAFFGGEAGDEIEVGFTGLHAVFAGLVFEADFSADVGQLLLGQHVGDDVGHRLALENPPVGTQVETRQGRFDHGGVAGATKAGITLLEQADQAMDITHRSVATP